MSERSSETSRNDGRDEQTTHTSHDERGLRDDDRPPGDGGEGESSVGGCEPLVIWGSDVTITDHVTRSQGSDDYVSTFLRGANGPSKGNDLRLNSLLVTPRDGYRQGK